MAEMKTLTIRVKGQEGDSVETYELVDDKARSEIESLKDSIESIVNTGGSVAVTVNGVPADETGNIALTAKNVGALSINKGNAIEGVSVPVNADTLGGVPADQYALKSDIPDVGSGDINPDDPIDADTLQGKTLEEIKTTILIDSEVNASKLDGMTFEQLKTAILAEVVYQ